MQSGRSELRSIHAVVIELQTFFSIYFFNFLFHILLLFPILYTFFSLSFCSIDLTTLTVWYRELNSLTKTCGSFVLSRPSMLWRCDSPALTTRTVRYGELNSLTKARGPFMVSTICAMALCYLFLLYYLPD